MGECNNATMQQCNNATMQQYTAIVNEIPSFFSIRDKDLNVVFLNKAIKKWIQQYIDIDLIGLSNKMIRQKTREHSHISNLFIKNYEQLKEFINQPIESDATFISFENNNIRYYVHVERFKIYLDGKLYICSIGNNLTTLVDDLKLCENQNYIDDLTNIYNRKVLKTINFKKTDMFLYFDLDNFKVINDTKGHQTGDMVLIEFSNLLMKTFRKDQDYIVRMGGDEFLVVIRSEKKAKINIDLKIKELKVGFDKVFSAFTSLGFSSGYCYYDKSFLDTMHICDGLMYQDKNNHKLLSITNDV